MHNFQKNEDGIEKEWAKLGGNHNSQIEVIYVPGFVFPDCKFELICFIQL